MDARRTNHLIAPTVRVTISRLISIATDLTDVGAGGTWEQKLRSLIAKLTAIQGALPDAEEWMVDDHPAELERWLEKLRDVTSEVEDVLEEAAYENLKSKIEEIKKKVGTPFLSCFSNSTAFGRQMVNKISSLIARVDVVMEEALVFGFQSRLTIGNGNAPPRSRCRENRRQTLASFTEPIVVGRERDISSVADMLTDATGQQSISLVSIVGMGGVGKTTLAKALLGDDRIKSHFSKVMWVYAGVTFDVVSILVKMVESLTKNPCLDRNKDHVLQKLKEYLRRNNYLLILDDVWNEDRQKWEELQSCLLYISEKASIGVLLTTRNVKLAMVSGTHYHHLYPIGGLNEADIWSLIKQRAFGDTSPTPELESIVLRMANLCRGIPLIASLLGSMLRNKEITNVHRWLEILDSLEIKDQGMIPMLFLGFQILPEPALKLLFAFCSIFPKDSVMDREMLIQLWMAEGYLQLPYGESEMATEDIGDKYFNDLLSYSLFQEMERDFHGNIISCKVHDLIHDLAEYVSKSQTLMLDECFSILNSNHVTLRHLNLINGEQMDMASTVLEEGAQSLLTLFSNCDFSCDRPRALKRLRVLSLCGAEIESLPSWCENLKSLRYFDISGTQMKEFPKFICKQYYLQTLKFKNCKSLRMPSEGIGFLINLRHVYFDDEERMPANIGRLTSLQTLQFFFVGAAKGRKIEEVGSLSKLKGRLEILNLELVKGKSEAVKAKLQEKVLDELTLIWGEELDEGDDDEVLEGLQPHSNLQRLSIKGYRGKKLASWGLKNLVKLKIEGCAKLKSIPTMREFSSLKWLSVEGCSELIDINDGAFAATVLTEIFIKNCPKLKRVPVSGLSSLERLDIRNCRELSSMGDSLSTSTHLTDLYLYGCPNLRLIPSLHGLTSLQNLKIWSCGRLESLPSGLSSCTVLRDLSIWNCRRLASISEEVKDLHSVVSLDIFFCFGLKSFPEQSLCFLTSLKRLFIGAFSPELKEFPGLSSIPSSLEELFLNGWDTLTELPHQIQHLTTLKTLYIMGFNKLEELPEWLGNLSSLQRLQIWQCSNLRNLPSEGAILGLSKLVSLRITECPKLTEKCARETGPEWSKISHIPEIIMNYEAKSNPKIETGEASNGQQEP